MRKDGCGVARSILRVKERIEVVGCGNTDQKHLAFRRAWLHIDVKRRQPDQVPGSA
jgi:hypothetical protein